MILQNKGGKKRKTLCGDPQHWTLMIKYRSWNSNGWQAKTHYYLKYNLFKEGCGDGAGRPVQDWFLSPVTTELCIVWGWCSYSNNFSPLCSSSLTALQHLSSQLDYILRSGPKYISSTYCWAPTCSKTVLSSVPSPIIPVCSDTSPLTFYGSALTAGKNGHIV